MCRGVECVSQQVSVGMAARLLWWQTGVPAEHRSGLMVLMETLLKGPDQLSAGVSKHWSSIEFFSGVS